jgi:hypothetical protein
MIAVAALLAAGLLTGCGTSTGDEDGTGSKHQALHGVSAYGYPAGQPKDAESPALSSSTEQQYSRDQAEEAEGGKKEEGKAPKAEGKKE